MEILFWLLPAALVTVVAMVAVAWFGREHDEEVDQEAAARRIGEALARQEGRGPGYAVVRRTSPPVTGVKVRRTVEVEDTGQQAS